MKKTICDQCGKTFERYLSHKNANHRFCDMQCYAKWQIKSRSGKNGSNWQGGKIEKNCIICDKLFLVGRARANGNDGDRGKYCSRGCYDEMQKTRFGNKSCRWRGGITKESELLRKRAEYRIWRKAIFERDNFTCQKSGRRGGSLVAHHINNFQEFPELRLAIDNGITFSKEEHIKFHKKYGFQNNTLEQLEEFLYVLH